MAIALNAISSDCNMGTTASVSHTAAGSDRYVVAFAYVNADCTATATYGGVSMTQLARLNIISGTSNTIFMFGLANPSTG